MQPVRFERRVLLFTRQELLQPLDGFIRAAMAIPERHQRGCQAQSQFGVPFLPASALQRPGQRQAQVVQLDLQPLLDADLVWPADAFLQRLGQIEVILQVALAHGSGLPRLDQLLVGVLADGLQHAEAVQTSESTAGLY